MVSAREGESILDAARDAGVAIPTLCHLDGLSDVGACRLCLVEVGGRLRPACTTTVVEGMEIQTNTQRLRDYRRQIVELLFAERSHVCAVCVASGHCELQDLAVSLGMDHVRYEYLAPTCEVDISHERFGIDHNRCVLCTRCVRACDEVEGAHMGHLRPRRLGPRDQRPEPALGRGRELHLLRQVPAGLPDRRALPARLHGGRDGARPRPDRPDR